MNAEVRALAAGVAADGLRTSHDGSSRRVPDHLWPALVRLLDHERLTGLALAAVVAGRLDISEAQAAELVARHRTWMDVSLRREREALRVHGALAAADVPSVLLKGPAMAHRFYPDPGLRPFRDVDVLVRTRDWERACAVATSLGHRRCRPEPRAGFDVRFGKGATHRDASGTELDLHRTLVVGPFGLWIDADDLFDATEELELGGSHVTCLDASATFVHAIVHAALGTHPPPLLVLRDVVQVDASGLVDWERVARWAHDWRLAAVVDHALDTVRRELGIPPSRDAHGVGHMEPRPGERRALRAHLPPRRDRGGPARATLRAIRGPRAKLAYIRALTAPTPDFLRAREGRTGIRARARRWGHAAAWLVPDSGR